MFYLFIFEHWVHSIRTCMDTLSFWNWIIDLNLKCRNNSGSYFHNSDNSVYSDSAIKIASGAVTSMRVWENLVNISWTKANQKKFFYYVHLTDFIYTFQFGELICVLRYIYNIISLFHNILTVSFTNNLSSKKKSKLVRIRKKMGSKSWFFFDS